MNVVALQGNITRDGDVRNFQNGGQVTSFGVAVNRRYQKDGEWVERTSFVDCKYYGTQKVSKGDPVVLGGELETESWETDGQKRSKLVVRVNTLKKFARFAKTDTNPTSETAPKSEELVGAGVGNDGGNGEEIPF